MVKEFLLPLLYFSVLVFLLVYFNRRSKAAMPAIFVGLFFTGKCMAGYLLNVISYRYFPNHGDIYLYFTDGRDLYYLFRESPSDFITRLGQMFSLQDMDMTRSDSSFINAVFEGIKFFHFLLNLLSGGNLTTNTILFNGLIVAAQLRCWRYFKQQYGSWSIGAWIFLFPSMFLYTAGILKEGILIGLLCLLVPLADKMLNHFKLKQLPAFFLLFGLLFFFKFFVALIFLVAVFVWWWLHRYPGYAASIFTAAFVGLVLVFFVAGKLHPALSLPQYLARRQHEFLLLPASSSIPVRTLCPSIGCFVKSFPSAVINAFFRPLPGDGGKKFYLLFFLEIFVFWLLLAATVVKSFLSGKKRFKAAPIFWAMLLFALLNILVIGYTIPNIGALIRYRCIFLPFIGCFVWQLFSGREVFSNIIGRMKSISFAAKN